jgi:hypothetical protein
MPIKRLALFGLLCLLAACATTPAGVVAELQSGYLAAAGAESAYIASGKATVPVVDQIETYRLAAFNDIEPLVKAEESGGSVVDTAKVEAAQAALTALTNYLSTEKIGS